ncbi:MAG: hypothetical protein R8M46_09210 [Ghiorsea sp.]
MVSFLNVHLPLLMQVNRSEGGTLLPWPNGSLLSGRLMPPTEGSGAMLMLGNYRVRVEVPPNTPMGHIWLQLMQREMPGQFRLLTNKQAEALIAEMLQQSNTKEGVPRGANQEQGSTKGQAGSQQEWGKLPTDNLPFTVEAYGERLMLRDEQGGGTQGLLQKEEGKDSFTLSCRLDLEHLGGLAFSLEGTPDKTWKVHIHLENKVFKYDVEQKFVDWLAQQQVDGAQKLEGSVFDYIPETLGRSSDRKA